jgi:biopolymer transport protein ExbD
MAELSISANKKLVPKVDLTAMVDLAFLLVTFFMLTTSLSKPVAMDIVKPDKTVDGNSIELPASRTMTILLGKHNKIAWYMGEAGKSRPKIEGFDQIRRSIFLNKLKADQLKGVRGKSLYVIIKPTSGATYQNFVDIMDELDITKITTAPAIDDDHITAIERDFMKENKIL